MVSAPRTVLLIEPDAPQARMMLRLLRESRYEVDYVSSLGAALPRLRSEDHAIVITALRLPDARSGEVLEHIRRTRPGAPVVVVAAGVSASLAADAISRGACEVVDRDEILARLTEALDEARLRVDAPPAAGPSPLTRIVTQSRLMQALFSQVRSAARSDVAVLVQGESGTGKELVARAVHELSPRASGPFVAVNCAGLPETLLEAELFGHERGAFTGAIARKPGRFELAAGGTLFLDEIGEMHPLLQAKLLRVLQEGEFQRVGGTETLRADARIVSATNRDLDAAIDDGTFRADLYYRLAVFTLHIAPLRERLGDIPILVRHFVERFARREDRTIESIDPRVLELLARHRFPGNVRELENLVARAVVSAHSNRLTLSNLPPDFLRAVTKAKSSVPPTDEEPRSADATSSITPSSTAPASTTCPSADVPDGPAAADTPFPTLAEMERLHIERALRRTGGRRTEAAALLGISRMTLYRKLRADM